MQPIDSVGFYDLITSHRDNKLRILEYKHLKHRVKIFPIRKYTNQKQDSLTIGREFGDFAN